jgi:N-acetylneuraminate lyase
VPHRKRSDVYRAGAARDRGEDALFLLAPRGRMFTFAGMSFPHLKGLISAPFTPFHPDGSLRTEMIPALARSLVTNGVHGAFVCGSTGEGTSLSMEERKQTATAWQEAAGPALKIIVHVGHTSLVEARALAAHAYEIGAWGIGCMAPYYFKPARLEELVAFCAEVAAAASALPFYYYHIPSMTGASFAMADFLRLAGDRIPNLAGIKFTYENLMDFAEAAQLENGRFDLVFGRDEMLLANLALGGQSAIGSTYNFMAPVFHRIIAAFESGDHAAAREAQARANAVIAVFLRHGGMPAAKAMMRMIKLDCGPVRLPLRPFTSQQYAALEEDLRSAGFFKICSEAA